MRARINFDDPQWSKSYDRVAAYGQSKLANLMFTYELQRRLSDLGKTIAVAAHPGAARSELIRNSPTVFRVISVALGPLIYQSAATGALPVLRAATDPSVVGGQYYGPSGFQELRGHPVRVESSKASRDESLQRRLWALSEELTGVKYPV
jgi:NAD(P)-dependent dehydrogenase (short-subunit alcohol dehydrogenase family)